MSGSIVGNPCAAEHSNTKGDSIRDQTSRGEGRDAEAKRIGIG
jgi:hypothetical protein